MGRRAGAGLMVLALGIAIPVQVGAHHERPGAAPQYDIVRGSLPSGGEFRLFGQRAKARFPDHLHRGSGNLLCLDLVVPESSGGSCGTGPTRREQLLLRMFGEECEVHDSSDGFSYATGTVSREAVRVVLTYYDGLKIDATLHTPPRKLRLKKQVFFGARRYGVDLHYAAAFDADGRLLKRIRERRFPFGESVCRPPDTAWASQYKRDFGVIRRKRTKRDQMPALAIARIYEYGTEKENPQESRLLGRDRYDEPLYAVPAKRRGHCIYTPNASGSCGDLENAYGSLTAEICTRHTDSEIRFYGLLPDGVSNVHVVRRDQTTFPVEPTGNLIVGFGERLVTTRQPETLRWTWKGEEHSSSVPVPLDSATAPCGPPAGGSPKSIDV